MWCFKAIFGHHERSKQRFTIGWVKTAILVLVVLACTMAFASPWEAAPANAVDVVIGGVPAKAWASSTLKVRELDRYSVKNLFDGNPETAWVENSRDRRIGEWIQVEFDRPVEMMGFVIRPGYQKTETTFTENQAPSRIQVSMDRRPLGEYDLRYHLASGTKNQVHDCTPSMRADNRVPEIVVFPEPVRGKLVQLHVLAVAHSDRVNYDDLAISDWIPILRSGETPDRVVTAAFNFLNSYAKSGALDQNRFPANAHVIDVLGPLLTPVQLLEESLRKQMVAAGATPFKDSLVNFSTVTHKTYLNTPVAIISMANFHQLVGGRVVTLSGSPDKLDVFPSIELAVSGDGPNSTYTINRLDLLTTDGECESRKLPDVLHWGTIEN